MTENNQSANAMYGSSSAVVLKHPETGETLMVLRIGMEHSPNLPERTRLVIMDMMEYFMASAEAVANSVKYRP